MEEQDDKIISLVLFVDDLLAVCRKHGAEEIFEGYIGKFVNDMRAAGLITNINDESGENY